MLVGEYDELDFKIAPKLKETINDLRLIGNRRLKMHDVYLNTFLKVKKLYEEIGNRMNFTVLQAQNLKYKELENFLLKGRKVSKEIIDNRIKYYCLYYLKSNYRLDIKPVKEKNNYKIKKEIKGKTAFPGKIIGQVRIITHRLEKSLKEEMFNFDQGNILVSVSTSPDLMPVIRKAGAVITEVGGLLSHAAIVSRELKIPCIINVKMATKIFKNGDRVEVDATNGIIKKI